MTIPPVAPFWTLAPSRQVVRASWGLELDREAALMMVAAYREALFPVPIGFLSPDTTEQFRELLDCVVGLGWLEKAEAARLRVGVRGS